MAHPIWYLYIALWCLFLFMVVVIITKIFVLWKYFRRETIAFIITRDKTTEKSYRINPSKESFTHKGAAYFIVEPYVRWLNKRFLFYVSGNPEPVNIVNTKKPMIRGDVYQTILDNEIIKALNRGGGLGAWLVANWKTVAVVLIGFFAVYYFLSGGTIS